MAMSHLIILIAESFKALRMTGRKRGLGSEVPSKKSEVPSKKKYRCNVAGCAVTPRGCDLPKHYKTKTNWDKVIKSRAVMGTAALERQLGVVDAHTRFCYEQGYTEAKLPQWESHIAVKGNNECDEGRESTSTGPKQLKLTELFQVKK
jgi:hypothetical protein